MTLKERLLALLGDAKSRSFGRIIQYSDMRHEILDYIEATKPGMSLTEAAYTIIVAKPEVKECGKFPVFNTYEKGYRQFCGAKSVCECSRSEQSSKLTAIHSIKTDEEKSAVIAKMETTCLEKYGVKNGAQQAAKSSLKHTRIKQAATEPAPKCRNPECENLVRLRTDKTWAEHCSDKCRGVDNSKMSTVKRKETMLARHGVEHALQNANIFQKMKDDNVCKYGTAYPTQLENVRAKRDATMLSRYGHVSIWSDPQKYQRTVDIVAVKYGYQPGDFTNVSQIPEVNDKKSESQYTHRDYILPSGGTARVQGYEDRFLDTYLKFHHESTIESYPSPVVYLEDNSEHFYFPDFKAGGVIVEVKSDYTFLSQYDKNLLKIDAVIDSGSPMLLKVTSSKGVDSYLYVDEKVRDVGRYLESMNIAFGRFKQVGQFIFHYVFEESKTALFLTDNEYASDLYCHSTYFDDMVRLTGDLGYRVYILPLSTNFNTLCNFITFKCTGSSNFKRIYARQCIIDSEVSRSETSKFLNENHIQGVDVSSIAVGLRHDGNLVALMTFTKYAKVSKVVPKTAYVLSRYATSSHVVGGASKLLKFFRNTSGTSVVSYSDNRVSDGNMYLKLGFELIHKVKPSYRYISDSGETYDKRRFSHSSMEMLANFNYDPTKTELENTEANRYRRLYDAGKLTWFLE